MPHKAVVSKKSSSLNKDQTNLLFKRYGIPQSRANIKQLVNLLQRLNRYEKALSKFQSRMNVFNNKGKDIVTQQLSVQNISLLKSAYNDGVNIYKNPSVILNDALGLFHHHITSIIQETGNSILHENVGVKLGAALSFPGKMFDGINFFWNDLVKKHPILAPLDIIIVKPMIISLYVHMLPEIAIIKACELVGRSIVGIASTGEWKESIIGAIQTIAESTLKHFGNLINNYQVDQENPRAASGEKHESEDAADNMQNYKISIQDLCGNGTDDITQSLKKVFATAKGHLPKIKKTLPEVLSTIEKSSEINEHKKANMIEHIAAYIVKKNIEKSKNLEKVEPIKKVNIRAKTKTSTYVKKENKRRVDSGELSLTINDRL